jgi:hypothetical protein
LTCLRETTETMPERTIKTEGHGGRQLGKVELPFFARR